MKKFYGKSGSLFIIIILLTAILLAVTNPQKENHIDAIVNKLESENSLNGLIARGVLTFSPPDYRNLALASYTVFNKQLATVGLAGYVYVNKNAFRM